MTAAAGPAIHAADLCVRQATPLQVSQQNDEERETSAAIVLKS